MKLHVLPAGPIQTNAYLLAAPDRREALLIDAPGSIWSRVQPLLAEHGCRLTELWLTHGHWDHTQGAAEVVRETGARVSGHAADRDLFEEPRVMSAFTPGLALEPVLVDRWLQGGERLPALGLEASVRHVPGHCPGNVLFHFGASKAAFVGDAIFQGAVGRTDIPGGDFAELERSIREQIYTLPDETTIFPGHGPRTTVGAEKEGNPFVRG
ncbi:MAG: MBL fold metallo-hydrolase [Opitutaceae bacterium]